MKLTQMQLQQQLHLCQFHVDFVLFLFQFCFIFVLILLQYFFHARTGATKRKLGANQSGPPSPAAVPASCAAPVHTYVRTYVTYVRTYVRKWISRSKVHFINSLQMTEAMLQEKANLTQRNSKRKRIGFNKSIFQQTSFNFH